MVQSYRKYNHLVELLGCIYEKRDNFIKEKEIIKELPKREKDRDKLISALKIHKCFEIAIKNGESIKNDNDALLSFIERMKIRYIDSSKTIAEKDLNRIENLIQHRDYIKIKGSTLYRLYPEEYIRHQRDVDLLVPTLQEMVHIYQDIQEAYYFKRIKVYCGKKTYTASVDLLSDTDSIDIDLHLNPYYIWGGVFFNCSWEKSDSHMLSNEDQLIMIIAHSANQWLYRMRDVTDLYLLGKRDLDWHYIEYQLESLDLVPILHVFQRKAYDIYHKCVGCEEIPKLTLGEWLYYRYNFGEASFIGSCLLETVFCYRNYKKQMYNHPLLETIYNTYNMFKFHNRAFFVNKKRKVKKYHENRVLIYVNNPNQSGHTKEKGVIIRNRGKQNETILTPIGELIQSSYYGNID